MASYFSFCGGCKKRKFRVARRKYKSPKLGAIATSQAELCRTCYKMTKRMLESA